LLELAIVAAFSLLVASAIRSTIGAMASVFGFYLLARGVGSLQLMARGPFFDASDPADRFLAAAIDGVALLLPPLDRFARVDWLIAGHVDSGTLAILIHALVYLGMLATAGLIDLRRRQL
jgi:hypothetical protein